MIFYNKYFLLVEITMKLAWKWHFGIDGGRLTKRWCLFFGFSYIGFRVKVGFRVRFRVRVSEGDLWLTNKMI